MKEIVQDGTPVLRGIAQAVPEAMFGTPELAQIITDMETALDPQPEGVALAAPQIAIPYRIFIVRMDRVIPPQPYTEGEEAPVRKAQNDVYINPQIIKTSRRRTRMDEGCLSVHNIYGTTERYERATVRAQHEDGSTFERGGGGLLAQIFQHETDHLIGVLFTDHADHLIEIHHEQAA